MIWRPLPSQDELKKLFQYDPETGDLTWKMSLSNRAPVGFICRGLVVSIRRQHFEIARVIWKWMTGDDPDTVDHENRNHSDNRWTNLRNATFQQNLWNKGPQRNSKSGYAGVVWFRNKWWAYIDHDRIREELGSFAVKEEAVAARARREVELRGEFAVNRGVVS